MYTPVLPDIVPVDTDEFAWFSAIQSEGALEATVG